MNNRMREIEEAMEWCPDELDHRFHTDKYVCVKIASLISRVRALEDLVGKKDEALCVAEYNMVRCEWSEDGAGLKSVRKALALRVEDEQGAKGETKL